MHNHSFECIFDYVSALHQNLQYNTTAHINQTCTYICTFEEMINMLYVLLYIRY